MVGEQLLREHVGKRQGRGSRTQKQGLRSKLGLERVDAQVGERGHHKQKERERAGKELGLTREEGLCGRTCRKARRRAHAAGAYHARERATNHGD